MHWNLEYGVGEGVGKELPWPRTAQNPPVTTQTCLFRLGSHRLDQLVVTIQIVPKYKKALGYQNSFVCAM